MHQKFYFLLCLAKAAKNLMPKLRRQDPNSKSLVCQPFALCTLWAWSAKAIFGQGMLLCGLFLMSTTAQAQEQAKLLSMVKYPDLSSTRISVQCTKVPDYELNTNGQKVDLILKQVEVSESFELLSSDGDIVDSLVARDGESVLLSLLLRRPPERVEVMTLDNNEIQLELFWVDSLQRSRPAITDDPGGMLSMMAQDTIAGRFLSSPYSGRWHQFFSEYESMLQMDLPLRFSRQQYPVAVRNVWNTGLPRVALDQAAKGEWMSALEVVGEMRAGSKPAYNGLIAEFLLRSGRIDQAREVIESVFVSAKDQEELSARLHLLRAYILLAAKQPYLAYCHIFSSPRPKDLDELSEQYWIMLQVELSLATGRYEQALELAADQSLAGTELQERMVLRRIQALLALERQEQAWQELQRLDLSLNRLLASPKAMAEIAELYYKQEEYTRARALFSQLASELAPDQGRATALWRSGMSIWRSGYKQEAENFLRQIYREYPETAGGYRARLSLNDMAVSSAFPELRMDQTAAYSEVARNSEQRMVREEARFKEILVLHLLGKKEHTVRRLTEFLAQFWSGPLQLHAQVLITELVPKLAMQYFEQQEIVKGLACVAQHRDILVKSELSSEFLMTLGRVFEQLGLSERAARVYLYMLSKAEQEEEAGELTINLIRIWSRDGLVNQILQQAELYNKEFPQGRHNLDISALTAKSLLAKGQPEKALDYLLSNQAGPLSRELDVYTAQALYAAGKYAGLDRYLQRARMHQESLPAEVRFQWAQAKSRLGHKEQALALYQHIGQGKSRYAAPAMYQAAELLADLGQNEEAVKAYEQLADKTEGTFWAELAAESGLYVQFAAELGFED